MEVVSIKSTTFKKIYKTIKNYNEIVIARHIGPDPDAIGAQVALRDSIRLTFPEKSVYAVGANVSKFKAYGFMDHPKLEELHKPLLIVVDVPNLKRIDGIEGLNYSEIIIIDHHPREDIPSSIGWVDSKKASASEMVAELIMNTRLKMNEKIANNLFLGIVSDSERFSTKNTTTETFDTTKRLIEVSHIDFTNLYEILYRRPFLEHKFIAFITNNLVIDENKLGYIKISDETLKEYGVDTATPSNIINSYNFIDELLVWIFVTEDIKNNQYKISIRSRGPIINEIASKYNGGGHKYACGARVDDMASVDSLIQELSKACKDYEDSKLQKDKE